MSSSSALLRPIAVLAAIATLTALGLAIMLVRSSSAARQAAGQMHVVFTAQAPIIDQANRREQQRDAALAKAVAKVSQEKRAANKPGEIVGRLPDALPVLPRPLSVALAPRAPDGSAPPAVITVPQDDLKPLFDHLEDCRVCKEQLGTAQQDLRDERAKAAALIIERDAAVKAAHGGGFWARFRSGAKWFVIGGALGAVAASAVHR